MEKSCDNMEMRLTCANECAQVAAKEEASVKLMASIAAPFFEEHKRAAIDVVTVIDRSGSMSDANKMNLVKETLGFMIKQLRADDRLSIVSYDDRIETTLALTTMDAKGKEHAQNALNGIQPRGSTDLCAGLVQGIQIIKDRVGDANAVASVLLFTDGLANHGIANTDGILRAMGTDLPCSVHTFGYGSDHDANMLKAISDTGSGVYFFLEDKDDIPDAFADCLGGLLSVVAQNISLTLEPLEGAKITAVHTKFKLQEKQGVFTITLGDIQSEEERDILCTAKLPALSVPHQSVPVIRAKLSYFNVITSQQHETAVTLTIARPTHVEKAEVNYKVDLQKNRIAAANAISEAKELGAKGDYKTGREVVQNTITQLQKSASNADSFTQTLVSDLNRTLDGLKDFTSYTSFGYHQMNATAGSHYQQRSAGTKASPSYSTTSKVTTKSVFSSKK